MPRHIRDTLTVATLLAASAFFLWRGAKSSPTAERTVPVTPASLSSEPRYKPVPQVIETITIGQRMWIGENPSDERDHRVGADIADPSGSCMGTPIPISSPRLLTLSIPAVRGLTGSCTRVYYRETAASPLIETPDGSPCPR